ncbi:MAG TPA: serine O-acetyltransferase EpsC [Vicinamibacterales bacterium]|jgi:serine O-acetyltransferase
MNTPHWPRASGEDPQRTPVSGPALSAIVQALCATEDGLVRPESEGCHPHLPSRETMARTIDDFRAALFPGYVGTTSELSAEALRFHVGATLDRLFRTTAEQVRRAFCFACRERDPGRCMDCEERARGVSREFFDRLPAVRRLLATDVQAAYEGDPAATSPVETILCYPGILALTCHRLAHELYRLEVPLLPRIISEQAHGMTGIDIHPGAQIGSHFFIDHGTGVVVGETCVIGERVRLYQGVTLGARSFPLDEHGHPVKGVPRHPIVGDDVIIYSGATVLGRITVGAGSQIGGNVWLTHSVPPGSRISQVEVKQVLYSEGGGI